MVTTSKAEATPKGWQRANDVVQQSLNGNPQPHSTAVRTSPTSLKAAIERIQHFTIVLLFVTMLAGILVSHLYFTPSELHLRTRLPAKVFTFSTSEMAFDIPQSVFPAYFANKRNIFNQFFVKKGWAWTTLAFFSHYLSYHLSAHNPGDRPRVWTLQPLLRWFIATLFWSAFTQWLFGPSLSHRLLMATGAECSPSSLSSESSLDSMLKLDPSMCTSGGRAAFADTEASLGYPYWRGGHDVSGHTFILVHSALLLVTTIAPTLCQAYARGLSTLPPALRWTTAACLAITGLWWWMLLMTSTFFHSPQEKFTGFVVALAGCLSYSATVG